MERKLPIFVTNQTKSLVALFSLISPPLLQTPTRLESKCAPVETMRCTGLPSVMGVSSYRSLCTIWGCPAICRTVNVENSFTAILYSGNSCKRKNETILKPPLNQDLSSLIHHATELQVRANILQARHFGFLLSKQNEMHVRNQLYIQAYGQKRRICKAVEKTKKSRSDHKQPNSYQARVPDLAGTQGEGLKGKPTVIVFDLETTGFSRAKDRIIEFACQDLAGGVYSTFSSLVNPGLPVRNHFVHGITTEMVNRPDVPRWEVLAPILIRYIKARKKSEGCVIWVAHNARFDASFLAHECQRCSIEIPPDWVFVDSQELAREVSRLNGTKLPSIKLESLRLHYNIPSMGAAHRAMSDVKTLALVFQKLTHDLKLPVSDLMNRSFKI